MTVHAKDSASRSEADDNLGNGNGDGAIGMKSKLQRYPETGISVFIIGTGIDGLMNALECLRKGHSVMVLKRSAGLVHTGEL